MDDKLDLKNTDEREEWFLNALSAEKLPITQMIDVMKAEIKDGDKDCADGWSELLLDELAVRNDRDSGIKVVAFRVFINDGNENIRKIAKDSALKVLNDRSGKALVESCGFDDNVPVPECLRRLDILSRLKPGLLCSDKTWGFGEVTRVDDFYKKVTIDFSKRDAHQLSFAYAAETLEILNDDHLFALQFKDPERLAAMVIEDPAEVMILTLKSLGEMSVEAAQVCLLDHKIVSEDQWKVFWDKARKSLKANPLVEVPPKRRDKILLLDSEKSYDDAWFESFVKERDVDTVLRQLEELAAELDLAELSEKGKEAISNRVAFALKADDKSNPGRLAHGIVLWESMAWDGAPVDVAQYIGAFFNEDVFIKASSDVPVRFTQQFIARLAEEDEARFLELTIGGFEHMPIGVLNAVMDYLLANGRRDEVIATLTSAFNSRKVCCGLLLWVGRRDDILTQEGSLSFFNLIIQILVTLEGAYTGLQLKLRNQLASLLEQGEWLKSILEQMTPVQREDVLKRVKVQAGLDATLRRSVMAKMIKAYPELESIVASSSSKEPAVKVKGRLTSYRSFREKKEQLRKLIDEEVPANSKDIAIARSYGDLRENAEYETARTNQALLMKRKGELESDLVQVQAADFAAVPTDEVNAGTCVTVESADGASRTYNILGEWDRDESLNIISSRSKLAEILIGQKAGDEVDLPSTNGDVKHRITAVTELSAEIKSWINAM